MDHLISVIAPVRTVGLDRIIRCRTTTAHGDNIRNVALGVVSA